MNISKREVLLLIGTSVAVAFVLTMIFYGFTRAIDQPLPEQKKVCELLENGTPIESVVDGFNEASGSKKEVEAVVASAVLTECSEYQPQLSVYLWIGDE